MATKWISLDKLRYTVSKNLHAAAGKGGQDRWKGLIHK